MALEYENATTVLGKFGDVCQGPNLDWRHKCQDEIILATPMVFVDYKWEDLPYQAIISETSSINFRDPFESEGGEAGACDPSTANMTTSTCDFVLPNLEKISIGTQSREYMEWEKRFCRKYPTFRGYSPFTRSGNRVTFKESDDTEAMMTFAGHVNAELSTAIWTHMYRTYWLGLKENVDQFDGFFEIIDEGISSQGECADFPLTPTCFNFAEYILGAAAVAAGGLAHPGDVVLEVGDPNRPLDAPVDNIIDIYPGTIYATTLDITGMDVIDIMNRWYELVTNEWGIDVIDWMFGVGKNQTRCFAEVAACKQACKGGDCRQLLVGDNRDAQRAEREANYINSRSIQLYPYTETIRMRQSPALRARNMVVFMPWVFQTDDGPTNSLLWVWRDRQASVEALFSDVPGLRSQILRGNVTATDDLHNLAEFGSTISEAFESRAWDWLYDQNKNCFQWWNNAETALVPQAPHLWMCLTGVSCDSVITLPCNNPGVQAEILTCSAVTPNSEFRVTFANGGEFTACQLGDKIQIVSATGATQSYGTITTINDNGATTDINITLTELSAFADCTWDGVALASGGKVVYSSCP